VRLSWSKFPMLYVGWQFCPGTIGWLARDGRRSLTLFPKLNLYPSSSRFIARFRRKGEGRGTKKYLRSDWSTESACESYIYLAQSGKSPIGAKSN